MHPTCARRRDDGFTLIELMVVVLIIAILMAIAIPTFLSSRAQAQARAAEANLRSATVDEQTYFSSSTAATYGGAAVLVNYAVDAALQFVSVWPAPSPDIYVNVGTDATGRSAVLLGTRGGDGKSYWVYDDDGQLSYDTTAGTTQPTTLPLPDPQWP